MFFKGNIQSLATVNDPVNFWRKRNTEEIVPQNQMCTMTFREDIK